MRSFCTKEKFSNESYCFYSYKIKCPIRLADDLLTFFKVDAGPVKPKLVLVGSVSLLYLFYTKDNFLLHAQTLIKIWVFANTRKTRMLRYNNPSLNHSPWTILSPTTSKSNSSTLGQLYCSYLTLDFLFNHLP